MHALKCFHNKEGTLENWELTSFYHIFFHWLFLVLILWQFMNFNRRKMGQKCVNAWFSRVPSLSWKHFSIFSVTHAKYHLKQWHGLYILNTCNRAHKILFVSLSYDGNRHLAHISLCPLHSQEKIIIEFGHGWCNLTFYQFSLRN